VSKATIPDLLWLAGVIDATATITVKKVPHKDPAKPANYRAHVSFTTTIKALAEAASAIIEGVVIIPMARRSEGESTAYRWQAEAAKADRILRAVRPYLRIRGEQADAAIRVQALNATRAPKTPQHIAALDEAHQQALAAAAP
jgi:hypothetical protein